MKKIIDLLKSQIPFELQRPSSLFSIFIALFIAGFCLQFGTSISDDIYQYLKPHFPAFIKTIIDLLTYTINIPVSIITAALFIIIFFTIYRIADRTMLKKLKDTIIFNDDFESDKGWLLNYWGSNNPDKTCRFENSMLVFEAEESDLVDQRKEYGAYFDLMNGVYEKNLYEIICRVKADQGTTMGIKLWVHDTKGHNSIKFPANFYIPNITLEEIKVRFTGTSSQAMRIHLHIKPGRGEIYVDSVVIVKK